MSDTEYNAPEFDPILDGQVEDVQGDTAESTGTETDYFNWDDFADKTVKLPVAGEEIEVPLKEALAGYQRQADYTRKTQELSEQRQQVQFASAIQQALDNDPKQTIQLLQEHYGLNKQIEEDDIYLDPLEKQYRQLENRLQSFEQQQALQELEKNIGFLQSKYGEDFNANEVVAQALAIGSNDLEGVYKQVAFDRLLAKTQAQTTYDNRKVAQEQSAIEAKRGTNIVSSNTGSAAADTSASPVASLRDAFDLAKRQLGIS